MDGAGHRRPRAAWPRDHLLARGRTVGRGAVRRGARLLELRRTGEGGAGRPGHRSRGRVWRLARRADCRGVCGAVSRPSVLVDPGVGGAGLLAAGCTDLVLPAAPVAAVAAFLRWFGPLLWGNRGCQ